MKTHATLACALLICSVCALAADASSLSAEAQQKISAAINRDGKPRNPVSIGSFTLTASDGKDGDFFGRTVAIDGDTVVVGSDYKAYVFVKPKSGWQNMTETATLTASDNAPGFGPAVSISGNTIVVGAEGAIVNGNSDQGAAYVFTRPATGWRNMTETARLTASDGTTDSVFGSSVGINGNTIVVGAVAGQPDPGSAYIFVEPSGGWTDMTQTAELTASDGVDYDRFGISVSISGNTAIIGELTCNGTDHGPGAAYVYVEPATGWANMTETAELTSSDSMLCDWFGYAVSIAGNTAVVGALGNGLGAAYVFVEPPGGWVNTTETAKLGSIPAAGQLGSSVFVAGKVIAVGAEDARGNGIPDQGAAFLFLEPAGGWTNTSQYNLRLSVSFNLGFDYFGDAIALSGKTAIAGAYEAPSVPPCKPVCQRGPGEAFIFTEQ
jgi:hypothetical protein